MGRWQYWRGGNNNGRFVYLYNVVMSVVDLFLIIVPLLIFLLIRALKSVIVGLITVKTIPVSNSHIGVISK